MNNRSLPPKRPADFLFGGRREAIERHRCMPPPTGCGEPADEFEDALSEREYYISALCQKCQNKIWPGEEPQEEDPLEEEPPF